uniref:Uncharacterized protein n=1 Tax=Arundo donax TaxID=35708 RepID=A0A0A9F1K9_ARUDO
MSRALQCYHLRWMPNRRFSFKTWNWYWSQFRR